MSKRMRQYLGILAALVSYYAVHEGAHLAYACAIGVFEKIRFLGLGIQIVTDTQCMTDTQLGLFCALGAIATLIAAYGLTLATPAICKVESKVFKACMYYITMAMLLVDSMYFTSCADAKSSALISSLRGLILLLPFTFLFPAIWGMRGVWLATPATEALTACVSAFLIRKQKKRIERG